MADLGIIEGYFGTPWQWEASGTRLTGESDLGFPILVVCANLSHAHRNIHHSHGL